MSHCFFCGQDFGRQNFVVFDEYIINFLQKYFSWKNFKMPYVLLFEDKVKNALNNTDWLIKKQI